MSIDQDLLDRLMAGRDPGVWGVRVMEMAGAGGAREMGTTARGDRLPR